MHAAAQTASPAAAHCISLLSGHELLSSTTLRALGCDGGDVGNAGEAAAAPLSSCDPALASLLAVLASQGLAGRLARSQSFPALCTALDRALPHPSLLGMLPSGSSSGTGGGGDQGRGSAGAAVAALLPALASQLCCAGHSDVAAALVARRLRLHRDLATHDGAALLLQRYLAACAQADLLPLRLDDVLPEGDGTAAEAAVDAAGMHPQAAVGVPLAGSVQRLFGALAAGAQAAVRRLIEEQ